MIILFFIFLFIPNQSIEQEEDRGIFISYIELGNYLRGKDKKNGINIISRMVEDVDKLGFNIIILQVRAFSDAIYPSSIYPSSSVLVDKEGEKLTFDVLDTFIKFASKKNIKIIAWINPYRIRNDTDTSDISSSNPAYRYLDSRHVYIHNGIYYNPASDVVDELILEGIREILEHYSVNGILFDDYFYPNGEVDKIEYEKYLEKEPNTTLSEFRLREVNQLIKKVYNLCHEYHVSFSISPDGNIENNYSKHYADVKRWGSVKGYVDYLMPQIYYGFYNETKPFYQTLKEWESISSKVSLIPVLAFYKVGDIDTYAKSGQYEWVEEEDIIMREVLLSRNVSNIDGFSLFRYDYIFNDQYFTDTTMKEVENLKKVLD